ncbi:MAG: DHH family phosphoesterase [Erysipelotrichia bacterium]|nr:DHH family phosphoesterase [Erysipelotrichia bacterium]
MFNNKTDRLKLYVTAIFLVEIVVVLIFEFILKIEYGFLIYIYLFVFLVQLIYIFFFYDLDKKQRTIDINRILGNDAKQALEYGKVGIIIYDDEYMVTWVSDFLENDNKKMMGEKITKIIPGVENLIKGIEENILVHQNNKIYRYSKSDDEQAILVQDVTELETVKKNYADQQLVLGLISLDNYDETIQNEDEQRIALINTNIRQTVVTWVINNGGLVRRIRSDRLFVVIDRQHFNKMVESNFSILQDVKNEAKKLNVDITCSMCFGYGYLDFDEFDSTLNNLFELVLSRGGDQVAVKQYDKEVVFYGTSSEASEKVSKVRARVMANGLQQLIASSSKVIIVGHKDADLDCFGAALAVSKIASACEKTSYIVFNDIDIEPVTERVYNGSIMELMHDHIFINEEESLSLLDEDTLVVVVDHHSADLTSCPQLVKQAGRIAIIDHHRKKSETNIAAMMIYNEPAASSTVELLCELIQYQNKDIELTELEATIMYAGLLVDTDNLRNRCSARSFEVCAYLKKEKANISLANDWLKEDLTDFINKSNITKYMMILSGNIVVSAVPKNVGSLTRTSLAQGANYICTVKDIEAAFVIGQIDSNNVAVSARSNGKVNVQIILEKMGGGGHFNAAGLQRSNTTVAAVKDELLKAITDYQMQGGIKKDESNFID